MAQDIFIRIDGMTGEAQDAAHRGEIGVLRWNWSVFQQKNMHSGSGGGAGKATVNDLHFNHFIDKSSTTLLQFCLTGKHIPEAVLTVRKAGGASPVEFLKITMQELIVIRVVPVGYTYMPVPIEKVGLAFSKVKMEYLPQSAAGSKMGVVELGYDIKANSAI